MKKAVKNILALLLIASLLAGLTGCVPFGMRKKAAEALQQKYGEEFTIFSIGRNSWNSVPTSSFTAQCAPVSDETMRFTASIGSKGSLLSDTYVHAMNGRQVSEKIEPLAAAIAKSYVIDTRVRQYRIEDENWREAATLENVLQNSEEVSPYVRIIVDKATTKEMSYAEEYKLIADFYKNELPIEAVLAIYFVDAQILRKCSDYFDNNVEVRGDFRELVEKESFVRLGATEEGIIRISEEEYIERREAGINGTESI